MTIDIVSRWNGRVLFSMETDSWRLAVEAATAFFQGNPAAKEWVEHFVALGRNLSVKVEQPAVKL